MQNAAAADARTSGELGLVQANELLRLIFPHVEPSSKLLWLRRMQKRRLISYRKIGRLVFFDPAEVRREIDQQFTVQAASGVSKPEAE